MLKSDSERAIRMLAREWLKARPVLEQEHPSFLKFKYWLNEHHPQVLNFRSLLGPLEDAERWFDDELGQGWRN